MDDGRRRLRVAVLGATGHDHMSEDSAVECFAWDRLSKAKNLADYDVLILDLFSLPETDAFDVGEFKRLLNTKTAGQILGEGDSGAIYVLGDPRFDLLYDTLQGSVAEPFLFWTGMEFRWDGRGGEAVETTVDGRHGPLAPLSAGLDRYDYAMSDCEVVKDDEAGLWGVWDLEAFADRGLMAVCEVSDISTTRYGPSVAFVATHAVAPVRGSVERHMGGKSYRPAGGGPLVARSGPIVFVPRGRLSEGETIEIILRDVHGLETSSPEPGWVEGFAAPGQREIDEAIAGVDAEIAALSERRGGLLRKREEVRGPLALLYQTGDALEEAVWSALEDLGAEVERPGKGANAADGRARVPLGDGVLEFVLEIKGEKNEHFGIKSLRQLTDWISDAIDRGDAPPKALMVGNGSRTRHPRLRGWPFNPNFVANARRRGHAAVRSEDLYVAYVLDRRGELDRGGFWKQLHKTRGPVDMRPYREKLTAEEAGQLEVAKEG